MFMADIDEVIKEKGWSQKIKDTWDPLYDRGAYKYHRDVGENDEIIRTIPEYRIHSKAWIKWKNIVHEALIKRTGEKTFYIDTCTPVDIEVWHYPEKNKKTNYMELCEQDLEEEPDDYVMRLQLAIEYEIREEYAKAKQHFLILITRDNTLRDFEKARCYAGIGRLLVLEGNGKMAEGYYREGRLLYPNCADNYLMGAELCFNNKNYKQAIVLCEAALHNAGQAEWCNYYDIDSFFVFWMLGLSYANIGEYVKALAFLECAYQKNSIAEINEKKLEVFRCLNSNKGQI